MLECKERAGVSAYTVWDKTCVWCPLSLLHKMKFSINLGKFAGVVHGVALALCNNKFTKQCDAASITILVLIDCWLAKTKI